MRKPTKKQQAAIAVVIIAVLGVLEAYGIIDTGVREYLVGMLTEGSQ